MSMAAIFLVPVLAQIGNQVIPLLPFKGIEKRENDLRLSPYSGLIATTCLFFILFAASSYPSILRPLMTRILPANPENHPITAVQYLNSQPLPGKMFNNYGWGGYLIYALKPPRQVFIDGRADMYGEEIFTEYRKVISLDKNTDSILDKYDVNWVIYPHNSALVRYLLAGGRWREVYQDEEACVLLRNPVPRP